MPVSSWSTTAGSNTGILSGLTLDGSVMTPPQVDNAFRDMAAQIASQLGKMGFKGADIASAATTNLANATGWYLDITGTTTITAFGTVDAGQMFMLRFASTLTLTHNASSLILPGATNIITAAGAVAFMVSLGSGSWRCVNYQSAAGPAPTIQIISATGAFTYTPTAGARFADFEAVGGGGGAGGCAQAGSGTWGASGGGGSGFYGRTGPIDITGAATFSGSIGAAGLAGAAAAGTGGTGGSTTVTVGATTYTWPGGDGSPGVTANTSAHFIGQAADVSAAGTNVEGGSWAGTAGWSSVSDTIAIAGHGGSNPLGRGGNKQVLNAGGGVAGLAGTGRGAGGGGAAAAGPTTNRAGGAGIAGYMRVWEYY